MAETRPIVVIGGAGLLGEALTTELERRGLEFAAPGRDQLDLGGTAEAMLDSLRPLAPGAVINAAGFTDVARSELPEHRDEVYRLNRDAPGNLGRVCRQLEVPLIHVSTDYVFDGATKRPYREHDPTGPLQEYGRSKLAGEQLVREAYERALVVRVSTLFGPGRRRRPHYVDAVMRQAIDGGSVQVVKLPISSPTYTPDLARGLLELLRVRSSGVVHWVNSGACSRLELTRELVRELGLSDTVEVREKPKPSGELERPAYSVLDSSLFTELTGVRPRRWEEALREYLETKIQ